MRAAMTGDCRAETATVKERRGFLSSPARTGRLCCSRPKGSSLAARAPEHPPQVPRHNEPGSQPEQRPERRIL